MVTPASAERSSVQEGLAIHGHGFDQSLPYEAPSLGIADHLCDSLRRIGRLQLERRIGKHLTFHGVAQGRAGHPEARADESEGERGTEVHERSRRRAKTAESGSFVARKCHVAAAVATHRGELQKRRDRRDVSLEDDFAARDRGVEAFGYRGYKRLLGSRYVDHRIILREDTDMERCEQSAL
jgi:hypothetical protein